MRKLQSVHRLIQYKCGMTVTFRVYYSNRMFFNKFSKGELQEHKEIFGMFKDKDRNSFHIDKLKPILSSMGHYMSNDEIKKLVTKIDKNNDGLIQFEEFVYMLNAADLNSNSEGYSDIVVGMFEEFSRRNMKLEIHDIQKILKDTPLQQELKQTVGSLFQSMNKNGNNIIQAQQLANMLLYLSNDVM